MLYFISIQIHFLVVMKGFRTLLCVISLALSGVIVSDVMAQKELGVFNSLAVGVGVGTTAVSYTHLDVYKRQIVRCLLLAIYYDKLYCKANGLLAFLQVELLKIRCV